MAKCVFMVSVNPGVPNVKGDMAPVNCPVRTGQFTWTYCKVPWGICKCQGCPYCKMVKIGVKILLKSQISSSILLHCATFLLSEAAHDLIKIINP